MWKLNGDDVKAMLMAGAMIVIAMECVVMAITGDGIFLRG